MQGIDQDFLLEDVDDGYEKKAQPMNGPVLDHTISIDPFNDNDYRHDGIIKKNVSQMTKKSGVADNNHRKNQAHLNIPPQPIYNQR